MAEVYIYPPDSDDYSTIGICGRLNASLCDCELVANGMIELTLECPIDPMGRHRLLQEDYILKTEIPVLTTPEIVEGAFVTSVETWRVDRTATREKRTVYSQRYEGKKKKVLAGNTKVTVTKAPISGTRYKIKSGKVTGWIESEALINRVTETIPATPSGIETVMPSWEPKEQTFRIYNVDRMANKVVVSARHRSYDLTYNLTTYSAATAVSCQTAIDGVFGNTLDECEAVGYTDIQGTRVGVRTKDMNPIEALLDPEEGLCARWHAQLIRDEMEFYLLSSAGKDRGVRIEYAQNLEGVHMSRSLEGVYTHVRPIGETKNGGPLYLTTEKGLMACPNADRYPYMRIYPLRVSEAKVDNDVSTALARIRMEEAGQALIDTGIDEPAVSAKISFTNLPDSPKYAQYRVLQSCANLFDTITVWDPVRVDFTKKNLTLSDTGSITFSLCTASMSQDDIDAIFAAAGISSGSITVYIRFAVYDGNTLVMATALSSGSFTLVKTRVAPVINDLSLSDRHAAISGSDTPYDFFGGYVQGESLPTVTADFTLDSQFPDVTATHTLTITQGGETVLSRSASTAAGVTSVAFDLDTFDLTGAFDYEYTVTSAYLTDTETGTFTVYAYTPPSVMDFLLERYKTIPGGTELADDGTLLWLTLTGSISSVNSLNACSVVLSYSHDGGASTSVTVETDADGATLVYTRDATTFSGTTFSAAYTYDFVLTVTDMLRTVTMTGSVYKAGGFFCVEKNGVAVGMRAKNDPNDKRFDVAEDYTSHFGGEVFAEGGIHIDWEDLTVASGVTNPTTNLSTPRKLQIGKVGNHVYIRGQVDVAGASSGAKVIANLPSKYIPTYVKYSWGVYTGARIAKLFVNTSGEFSINAVYNISDGARYTTKSWLDCSFDYWLD